MHGHGHHEVVDLKRCVLSVDLHVVKLWWGYSNTLLLNLLQPVQGHSGSLVSHFFGASLSSWGSAVSTNAALICLVSLWLYLRHALIALMPVFHHCLGRGSGIITA